MAACSEGRSGKPSEQKQSTMQKKCSQNNTMHTGQSTSNLNRTELQKCNPCCRQVKSQVTSQVKSQVKWVKSSKSDANSMGNPLKWKVAVSRHTKQTSFRQRHNCMSSLNGRKQGIHLNNSLDPEIIRLCNQTLLHAMISVMQGYLHLPKTGPWS